MKKLIFSNLDLNRLQSIAFYFKIRWENIQSWTFANIRLLNKTYENEVTLIGQNICSKCYQPLKIMLYFEKRFRSFHSGNTYRVCRSKGFKELAVKVGLLKKKSAASAIPAELCVRFELDQGQIIFKI